MRALRRLVGGGGEGCLRFGTCTTGRYYATAGWCESALFVEVAEAISFGGGMPTFPEGAQIIAPMHGLARRI